MKSTADAESSLRHQQLVASQQSDIVEWYWRSFRRGALCVNDHVTAHVNRSCSSSYLLTYLLIFVCLYSDVFATVPRVLNSIGKIFRSSYFRSLQMHLDHVPSLLSFSEVLRFFSSLQVVQMLEKPFSSVTVSIQFLLAYSLAHLLTYLLASCMSAIRRRCCCFVRYRQEISFQQFVLFHVFPGSATIFRWSRRCLAIIHL